MHLRPTVILRVDVHSVNGSRQKARRTLCSLRMVAEQALRLRNSSQKPESLESGVSRPETHNYGVTISRCMSCRSAWQNRNASTLRRKHWRSELLEQVETCKNMQDSWTLVQDQIVQKCGWLIGETAINSRGSVR